MPIAGLSKAQQLSRRDKPRPPKLPKCCFNLPRGLSSRDPFPVGLAQPSEHPKVKSLKYPGLPSHRAQTLAKKRMRPLGSLIAVIFESEAEAERFINAADFVRPATSFGGTHASAERRARWEDKVSPGFVRTSMGCEPTKVLWHEMKRVLALKEAWSTARPCFSTSTGARRQSKYVVSGDERGCARLGISSDQRHYLV